MKKIFLLLLVAFTISSCSLFEEEDEFISPPSWLIGDWEVSEEGILSPTSYKVEEDNIIKTYTVDKVSTNVNFAVIYSTDLYTITEKITNDSIYKLQTEYSITGIDQSKTYTFTLLNDGTLDILESGIVGTVNYIKE